MDSPSSNPPSPAASTMKNEHAADSGESSIIPPQHPHNSSHIDSSLYHHHQNQSPPTYAMNGTSDGDSNVAAASYQNYYPHNNKRMMYHHPIAAVVNSKEQPSSSSSLAAAITVGSVLGLTAAAAVRWLNGGDFTLFPPATTYRMEQTTSRTNATITQQDNEQGIRVEQRDQLELQAALLVETVKSQTDRQEELLQQLQKNVVVLQKNNTKKQRENELLTNQSMELLRQQQQGQPIDQILLGIKSELTSIRRELVAAAATDGQEECDDAISSSSTPTVKNDAWESRLSATIEKLNVTLESISNDHNNNCSANKKCSVETPPHNNNKAQESMMLLSTTVTGSAGTVKLGSTVALARAIRRLVECNDSISLRSGAQLLYLYVVNVASHPRIPRYRKIFTTNESFQKHIHQLVGARELLASVGFFERQSSSSSKSATYWEWLPQSEDAADGDEVRPSPQKAWLGNTEETYLQRLKEAAAALSILKAVDTNSGDNINSKDHLINAALSCANLVSAQEEPFDEPSSNVDTLAVSTSTPRRPTTSTLNGNSGTAGVGGVAMPTDPFQTPDAGSVLSPPETKKQSFLSSPPRDFPSLGHPLDSEGSEIVSPAEATCNDTLSHPLPSRDTLMTLSEVGSGESRRSSSGSLDDTPETTMWK